MKLTLIGHEDRYAVEQLQMALFPEGHTAFPLQVSRGFVPCHLYSVTQVEGVGSSDVSVKGREKVLFKSSTSVHMSLPKQVM